LRESARLSEEDLVEIAETKGEQHLLAISARWWLKEVVTDALLGRGYPGVSRRITEFAVKKLVLNPTETRQTDETEKDKS